MTDSSIAIALTISKTLSTILSGIFGLIGLLTDFRNPKTKRITRWGKVALGGIVISSVVALVSQELESYKSTSDAKAAADAAQSQIAKSNIILKEVDRTLDPLKDVSVSYWLTVPIDEPEMYEYKLRLQAGVKEIVANQHKRNVGPPLGHPSRLNKEGQVEAVDIPLDSPLFPRSSEVVPYFVLRFSGLHLQFFANPNDPVLFSVNDPAKFPKPNLEIQVASADPLESQISYELEYDLTKERLQIVARRLWSEPTNWRSDGKIVSSLDLCNAQLAAVLDNTMWATSMPSDSVNTRISSIRSKMILGSVIFQVHDREFWLNMKNNVTGEQKFPMQRIERAAGEFPATTLYLTTLPSNLNALQIR